MANNLNYQQARVIRGQSLKDVIADELIRGKGFGSALKGAVGLKMQARMKGIKEKFDPLNIVKFLTFGMLCSIFKYSFFALFMAVWLFYVCTKSIIHERYI